MAFKYINAAVDWHSYAGMGIYVKHKARAGKDIRVLRHDPKTVWISCPDRELWLVKDHHHEQAEIPWGGNYDEYVNLNLWDPGVARAFGTDMFMTNFVYTEQHGAPNNRVNGRREGDPMVVTDSGGFQIITQKVDYIDPLMLVDHYNRNSDIGVVLDIPTRSEAGKDLIKRTAKVQKKNLLTMLGAKRKDLELMNVVHGHDSEIRKMFRDIVENDRVSRVCVGGAPDTSIVSAADVVAEIMCTGQTYKHYHALGVYQPASLLPLVLLGNMRNRKASYELTSDSSTALQSANHKMYHIQHEQYGPVRRMMIGDKNNTPNCNTRLPCQCPVCSTLKYADIFAVLDSGMIRHMLFLHNVYEIQRFTNALNLTAQTVTFKEFKELAKSVLANSKDKIKDAMRALDYVHTLEHYGLNEARKRFRVALISTSDWTGMPSNSLFEEPKAEVEKIVSKEIKGVSLVSSDSEDFIDHKVFLFQVLGRYEKTEQYKKEKAEAEAKQKEEKRERLRNRKPKDPAAGDSVGAKPKKKTKKQRTGAKRFSRAVKHGMKAHKVKKRSKKSKHKDSLKPVEANP